MEYSEEDKSAILGCLIHDERKRAKRSAETVSALSGISQQYLSEVERGRKMVSPYSMASVLESLKIPFCEDDSIVESAERIVDRMIDAYLRFDPESLKKHTEELLSERFHFSYAYLHYLSAKLVWKSLLEKQGALSSGPEAPNVSFSDSKRSMLDCLCVEKSLAKGQAEERAAVIQRGLTYYKPYSSSREMDGLYGALLFDLSDVYEAQGYLFDALELKRKTLRVIVPHYYVVFALSVELGIAALYSKLGQFCLSTEQCIRVIKSAEGLGHPALRRAAIFNLAENYMVAGQYQECINAAMELEPLPAEDDTFLPVYYLLAFSYFMKQERTSAMVYGKKLLERAEASSVSYRMTKMILDRIEGKFELSNAKESFREILRKGDQGDAAMAYRLLMNGLKESERYKDALECSEEYISYLSCTDQQFIHQKHP